MQEEKLETNNKKKKKKNSKNSKNNKFSLKAYLRDFLLFVDKNLIKCIGVLFVIAIVLIAISLKPMVSAAFFAECEGACTDGVTLVSDYVSKLQMLLFTVVAGLVPYVYIPAIGFATYVISEVSNISFLIKGYGYLVGIGMGIIPLLLNILAACSVTALGMYICRTVTVGYQVSSLKNMNFTNFKIKVYEVLQKQDKVEALTNKKEEKLNKLQAKKEKLNYIQILNTAIVVCIIQFVSVLILQILI